VAALEKQIKELESIPRYIIFYVRKALCQRELLVGKQSGETYVSAAKIFFPL